MGFDAAYERKWNDYRRRQRLWWFLLSTMVLLLAVPALQGAIETSLGIQRESILGGLFVAIAISNIYSYVWSCPRCGNAFFFSLSKNNAFAKKCIHCQLPKWSTDPEA